MKYVITAILFIFVTQVSAEEVPTIAAYQLLKNPFLYKNNKVILDPKQMPDLWEDGSINKILPITGVQFNRMITEDVAIYDVEAKAYYGSSIYSYNYETIGQLLVNFSEVPNTTPLDGPLSLSKLWLVKPLGVADGYNAFGGNITVPKIKFLGYVSDIESTKTVNKDKDEMTSNPVASKEQENQSTKVVEPEETANAPDTSIAGNSMTNEELITFANNYIDAINSTSVDELMTFYNEFVQFHGKNYSLDEIRKDKESYFKRWPEVTFNIDGEIELSNKGNVAEITIPVRYLVENEYRNEAVSGTALEQLIVSNIDGTWNIIAESEKKVDQKTHSTYKSTTKNEAKKEQEKDNTQDDTTTKTEDTNTQFNKAVSIYVDYLNGLTPNHRIASCIQYSSSSKLNDFKKAAFKRACEITGSNIAKPTPTQNPESYPRQQEEQQVDVNKVIDIIGDVIRRTY